MQIFKISPTIVRPLSANYDYDSFLNLTSYLDEFDGGLKFSLVNAFSAAKDASHNNHTSFVLSDERLINSNMKMDPPSGSKYPFFHQTYFQHAGTSKTWQTSGDGSIDINGPAAGSKAEQYFEIEFLNDFECVVRYYDSDTNVLSGLSWNQSTSAVNMISLSGGISYTWTDTLCTYNDNVEKFWYYLPQDGEITLLKTHENATSHTLSTKSADLSAAPWSGGFDGGSTWQIRSINPISRSISLSSDYYRYERGIETSSLYVDKANSIPDVLNNYLVTVTESDILSTVLNVNLFPLKNQITIDNNQSEGNPYHSNENAVHHRSYNKLHTGNTQAAGYDTVYMSYFSGTQEILLKSNEITYFHLPRSIEPYKTLNVNESLLYKSGAIPGNSPIVADKIFKRHQDPQNDTTVTDEHNGTYLCSWLSGSGSASSTPVWVDRYYNPDYTVLTHAMSSEAMYIEYQDDFDNKVELLSAQAHRLFDKKSDLTFEAGILYAYHHVGINDIEAALESLSDNETFRNIGNYRDFRDNDKTQVLADNGILNTYTLDGSSYGVSDQIDDTGSFTLTFAMDVDDWKKPFANQILGNFTNRGFSIENEHKVTPFIIFPDGEKIQVYNTDFAKVKTYDLESEVDGTIQQFTRKDVVDDIYFITTANTIYQYNTNGIIQNRVTTHDATTGNITDVEVDENNLYMAMGLSGVDMYVKYSLSAWEEDQGNVRGGFHNLDSTQQPHIHATNQSNPVLSSGVIVINTDAVSGNATTIDNNGNPWWVEGTDVMGYVDGGDITAVSAMSSGYIEQIQFDHRNNLWILHDQNTLSMLNSARRVVFSTALTATPSGSRFLDMVYEFGANGYEQYGLVMNFALTAADSNVFKVSPDGTLKSTVAVPLSTASPLSGIKSMTGWDYIRKQKLHTEPRLRSKLRVSKNFNQNLHHETFDDYIIDLDIKQFNPGKHTFAITFDAENGQYEMKVDSISISAIDIDTAWYITSRIFDQPLILGSPSFFNGEDLPSTLNQTLFYRQKDSVVKDVLLYNKPLNHYESGLILLKNSIIRDVKFDVPTGQRSFVDTVDRFFRHKLPVRRTSRYNVNIVNSGITSLELRNALEVELSNELERITPVAAELNQITWDADVEVLSAIELVPPVSTLAPTMSGLSNTDPVNNGGYTV